MSAKKKAKLTGIDEIKYRVEQAERCIIRHAVTVSRDFKNGILGRTQAMGSLHLAVTRRAEANADWARLARRNPF